MILEWLGSGAMGDVYKCLDRSSGKIVAIKWLHRLDMADRFASEARTLSTANHPNIARFIDYVYDDKFAYIIMEFVEGLTLEKLMNHSGRIPEAYAIKILKQVVEAVKYLHDNQIIHRDLKAANIKVMRNNTVKILDFGIAKTSFSDKLTAEGLLVGSMPSIAPEQFRNITTPKVDSWAIGVLFYQMLTRHLPFSNTSDIALRVAIEKGKYMAPEIFEPTLTRGSKLIIKNLLVTNPSKRWSVKLLRDYLSDGYVKSTRESSRTFLKTGWDQFKAVIKLKQ